MLFQEPRAVSAEAPPQPNLSRPRPPSRPKRAPKAKPPPSVANLADELGIARFTAIRERTLTRGGTAPAQGIAVETVTLSGGDGASFTSWVADCPSVTRA